MAKIFVRINPRTHAQKFRRCGVEFSQGWQAIDADEATEQRLRSEQMLEVIDAPAGTFDTLPEGMDAEELSKVLPTAPAEPKPSKARKASA